MKKILGLLAAVAAYVAVQYFLGASASHGMLLATAFIGWPDTNVGGQPQKRGAPGLVAGGLFRGFMQSWTKKTTDGNGTIYFLQSIPADAVIKSISLYNDALSGATSADCGLYKLDPSQQAAGVDQTAADYNAGYPTNGLPSGTNAYVDAGAIFASAVDIHSGNAQGSPLNFLSNIVVQTVTTLGGTTNGFLNYELKIWQLLGNPGTDISYKFKEDSYAIGLRLNTAGSATGNLVLFGDWIQG